MDIFQGAKAFSKELARALNRHKTVRLISHLDADGITSAAIMVKLLKEFNKEFHLTIVKQLTDEIIQKLKLEEYEFYIFTDLGSGKIEELEKMDKEVFVIDHHQIIGEPKKVKLFNPYLFNVNGSTEASGSVCTYLIAKEFGINEIAHLAIVGAIGDNQITSEGATGINKWVIENSEEVEMKKGINVFGRNSKPIHQALAQSMEINIPGISNDESGTVQFLSEIGIKIKDGDKFRTISELNQEETQKLINGLLIRSTNSKDDINRLFGYIYTIKTRKGILSDAGEFATLLNSFGRQGFYGLGVEICLGTKTEEIAKEILEEYRRKIIESLKWAKQNMEEKNGIHIINAKDNIPDTMIGTVASMLIRDKKYQIIVGFANSDGMTKVSIRAKENGINIGEIASKISKKVGGEGGGHKLAGGASIPLGKEEEFINLLIEEITWQKSK